MQVSVCICTYRRPALSACIASVLAQKGIDLGGIEVIVADDDPEQFAAPLVEKWIQRSSVSIRYLNVGSKNVAICRNACLKNASSDWIAFIDDDEIAEPDWLAELLRAEHLYACEVVKGSVHGRYPPGTPAWIVAGDPFADRYGPSGTIISHCATGNVLFSRQFSLEKGLQFDPELGLTGGEDSIFFSAFSRAGARIVSCETAVVQEIVPQNRTSIAYLRHRFRRNGRIHGTFFVLTKPFPRRVMETLKSLAIVGFCAPLFIFVPRNRHTSLMAYKKLWVHIGILESLFGMGLLSQNG